MFELEKLNKENAGDDVYEQRRLVFIVTPHLENWIIFDSGAKYSLDQCRPFCSGFTVLSIG